MININNPCMEDAQFTDQPQLQPHRRSNKGELVLEGDFIIVGEKAKGSHA